MKLELVATLMLLFTTGYTYLSAQYGTAIVCALCAGLVGGITVAHAIVRSQR